MILGVIPNQMNTEALSAYLANFVFANPLCLVLPIIYGLALLIKGLDPLRCQLMSAVIYCGSSLIPQEPIYQGILSQLFPFWHHCNVIELS